MEKNPWQPQSPQTIAAAPASLAGGGHALVQKLSPPWGEGALVARQQVMTLVTDNCKRVNILHAPAGFGKTATLCLLYHQYKNQQKPTVWISLSERDNDPVRLAALLLSALKDGVDSATEDKGLDDTASIIEKTFADGGLYLFLDNVEAITHPAAVGLIRQLVETASPEARLFLGTRDVGLLRPHKWQAQGDALIIRKDKLRFSDTEAAAFLALSSDVPITQGLVERALTISDGWVIALRFLKMSLRTMARGDEDFYDISSNRNSIHAYIKDEIFSTFNDDEFDFIKKTSLFPRFNARLCNEVLNRQDSADVIESLRDKCLLVQTSEEPPWYRHHPLLAQRLMDMLDNAPLDGLYDYYRRAAAWFANNQRPELAVDCLIRIDDWPAAMTFLNAHVGELVLAARWRRILRWAKLMPEPLLLGNEQVLAATIWAYALTRDVESLLALSRRISSLPVAAMGPVRCALQGAGVFQQLSEGDWGGAERQALIWLAEWPAGDVHGQGLMQIALGGIECAKGNFSLAESYLHTARELLRLVGSYAGVAHALAWLGYLKAVQGRLYEAGAVFRSTAWLGSAVGQDAEANYLLAIGGGFQLAQLYELNQLDAAEEWLGRLYRTAVTLPNTHSLVLMHVVRFRILHLRQGAEEACAYLQNIVRKADPLLRLLLERAARFEMARVQLATNHPQGLDPVLARQLDVSVEEHMPVGLILPSEEIDGGEIAMARLLIFTERVPEALKRLRRLEHEADKQGRQWRLCKIRIISALAYWAFGLHRKAVNCLLSALEVGAGTGAVRSFLDEGEPLLAILLHIEHSDSVRLSVAADRHYKSLLKAFAVEGELTSEPARPTPAGELNERELQIIKLLAIGLSNKAVADKLLLSINTVKWYTTRLYEKLGAKNRSQAIFVARQQRLIE